MNDRASTDELAAELRTALERHTEGLDLARVTRRVEALSARYRAVGPASSPILSTPEHVAAYAVYRMPATFAAVASALRQTATSRPDLTPATLLDLGGGTGAATWAAASVFPSLTHARVIDHAAAALDMGRTLAARSSHLALREAEWRKGSLGRDLPSADLVVVSYVLSELTADTQRAVVEGAAQAGRVVVIVEPGTPDGYQRVLAARDVLLGHGGSVVAPCPHSQACPLIGMDWCHFAVRVPRSSLHRKVKSAHLGHEDEKFSYVVVLLHSAGDEHGPSRVLRHPTKRKGLVQLELCQPGGTTTTEVISKRQGPVYRAARTADWGDAWPPAGHY